MSLLKIEFAVQMPTEECVKAVSDLLDSMEGVENINICKGKQQVIVDTKLPTSQIVDAVQEIGKKIIVRGIGNIDGENLGCAVCILNNDQVKGLIRFIQVQKTHCVIDASITGLTPGKHGFHIHEYGDVSNGCLSCGGHFNPHKVDHGAPGNDKTQRHVGDMGNIVANDKGVARFVFQDELINVWDIIGRAVVVHADEDDLGKTDHELSKTTGNAGGRVACGIIARSAGLFENSKKFCACDGKSLWDDSLFDFN